MKNEYKKIMKTDAEMITSALESFYEKGREKELNLLIDAEKYSLMAGGKRIRPIILLAVCRMFGGNDKAAIPYAMAVEMIHTASLIHDDLPSIDNDELRRGKPTCHVAFGEANALLAGDGLLMDAFGVVASNPNVSSDIAQNAVIALSRATGTWGLVGGEFIDVYGEGRGFDLDTLKKMDAYKTGALIRVTAELGALAAGVSFEDERMKDVIKYAENIGVAFQIIDDILDTTATAEQLGKTPGKDAAVNKTTYLSFYSVEQAQKIAENLTCEAIERIEKYNGSDFLIDLARYLTERKN